VSAMLWSEHDQNTFHQLNGRNDGAANVIVVWLSAAVGALCTMPLADVSTPRRAMGTRAGGLLGQRSQPSLRSFSFGIHAVGARRSRRAEERPALVRAMRESW
jgi:hypothetical protein